MNEKGGSQLRHLSEIAPSAHHRFDKESVHLRTMYRKLYPSEGPKTNRNAANVLINDTASQDSGAELMDLQGRKTLLGTNGLLNQRAYDSLGFQPKSTATVVPLSNHRQFGLTGMSAMQT